MQHESSPPQQPCSRAPQAWPWVDRLCGSSLCLHDCPCTQEPAQMSCIPCPQQQPLSLPASPLGACMHACPAAQGTCTLASAAGSHNMMAPGPAVNQQHSSCMAGACGVHLQAAVYTHLPMQTVLPMQPIAQNGCTAEHACTRTGARTPAKKAPSLCQSMQHYGHKGGFLQTNNCISRSFWIAATVSCSRCRTTLCTGHHCSLLQQPTAARQKHVTPGLSQTTLRNSTLVPATLEKQVWFM
jgi:hypothetical protein